MSTIFESSRAEADIIAVLAFTLEEWGPAKYWEYRDLIEEAYETILADPTLGRVMVPTRPNVLGYHIAKPGRKARHIVLFQVTGNKDIEIVRFLYDAMDLKHHL